MVHLPALPWQRCAHEGAVPAGGTLPAGVVHLCRRTPGQGGQQRSGPQPAPCGGKPEDQRRDPFTRGEQHQERPGFPVRHLALARPQPLPSTKLHPLPTSTRPSLNCYNTILDLTREIAPPGTRETAGRLSWTTTPTPKWPGNGTPGTGWREAPATEYAIFGGIPITPTRSPSAGTYAICRTGQGCRQKSNTRTVNYSKQSAKPPGTSSSPVPQCATRPTSSKTKV